MSSSYQTSGPGQSSNGWFGGKEVDRNKTRCYLAIDSEEFAQSVDSFTLLPSEILQSLDCDREVRRVTLKTVN